MFARSLSVFHFRIPSVCSAVMEGNTQALMSRFHQISNMLVSTKEEMKKYEEEFYGNTLIGRIEKTNEILLSRVKDAVAELTTLQDARNKLNDNRPILAASRDEKSNEGTSNAQVVHKSSKPPEQEKKLTAAVQNDNKMEKPKKVKEEKKPAAAGSDAAVDVGRLDMRIGRIVDVKRHPDADSLYVETVDIGKPDPITVVSGLVKHVPIEEMQNRLVVILTNLKPAKMRGVTSEGMVMCASSPDKVEVLRPPATAVPGDVVVVPGYSRSPDPVMNPKKKIFETVAPDLKTDDDLCATYKGAKWVVEGKGFVTADSLKGVNVK